MLAWTIYLSFAGAAAMFLLPRDNPRAARILALVVAVAGLIVALVGAHQHPGGKEIVDVARHSWLPIVGAEYHLAADGISLVMVILTGLATLGMAAFLGSQLVAQQPAPQPARHSGVPRTIPSPVRAASQQAFGADCGEPKSSNFVRRGCLRLKIL